MSITLNTTSGLVLAPSHVTLQKEQLLPAHPEYIEFTRRMDPLRRQIMEQRLVHISQFSIAQLLAAICRYDWYNDPIFDQPQWTDIVMEALRRGLIDRYATSTLLLFWERSNEEGKNLKIIPLFDKNGNPNLEAVQTITKSLEFGKATVMRSSNSYLTNHQLLQFFYEMKNAHNLQKFFFLSYEELQPYSGMSIQHQKLDCTPLMYFARSSQGDFCRMTPSPQMMVTFLTIHCGKKNAVLPNLILGPSEWKEFLDITKHDVQIPSPDEPVPQFVHDARAIKDDFTKHDLGYHLVIKSGIPKRMREIFAQVSLSIKKLEDLTPNPELGEDLHTWRESMLDMDLALFRQDRRQKMIQTYHLNPTDLSPLFWKAFALQLSMIKSDHIDDSTLKSIIMQMPIDPVLGKELSNESPIANAELFNTVAKIWEERLKLG